MTDRIVILTPTSGVPIVRCPPPASTGQAVATLVREADTNRRTGRNSTGQAIFGCALIFGGTLVISGAFSAPRSYPQTSEDRAASMPDKPAQNTPPAQPKPPPPAPPPNAAKPLTPQNLREGGSSPTRRRGQQ